ncbi:MAG: PAS domain-containing protein [Flavobacteriales bacterium]|nr:PAS domain-containing protein [Flavobacteriales bacterium]
MTKRTNHEALDHATLDDLIEGYQLIGFDWRYLYVNKAVVKQSKYASKDDLLGHTMMEKYPGIETTDLFKLLEKCMKTRTSGTMINEFTFPDDSKGWFELRIEPVPKGLFILSIDITERQRAEEAKKEYISSLEEMIYMTSHKIRQPICNLKGIINLVDNIQLTKADLKKITSFLPEAITALDNFTKELTAFIEEKKIKVKSWYNNG